jgi:hypothetical protein
MSNDHLEFSGEWVDITPHGNAPLAGYGANRMSNGAIDIPLEANAILLRHNGGRILFMQLDLLAASARLRNHLLGHLGERLRDDELFLVSSHTHYAPNLDPQCPGLGDLDDDYIAYVTEKTCKLADRVLAKTPQKIVLRYGEGQADHAINRRHWCHAFSPRFPFHRRVMALHPNPDGPKDETLRVFVLETDTAGSPAAAPVGILWNYACHSVCHGPIHRISAGYPGVVRKAVRERYRRDMPVVFLPGFSGNLRPKCLSRFPLSPFYLLHRIVNGPVFAKCSEKFFINWTSSLSGILVQTIDSRTTKKEISGIRSVRSTVSAKEWMKHGLVDRPLSFHLVQVDPLFSFLGISAEAVVEYGDMLRGLFPGRTFVPVGYIDGVVGYLPTSEMLAEGGLETTSPGYGFQGDSFKENITPLVCDLVRNLSELVH